MQLQTLWFGEGGRVLDASQEEPIVGQDLGLLVGVYEAELMPVGLTEAICFEYAVKSGSLDALLFESIVTRPGSESAESGC